MKIGIIVAMEKEFTQLKSLLEDMQTQQHRHLSVITGRIGQHEIVMQQCGIGKVNAAIGAVELINHHHPDLVISSGCAGGADTSLSPTDVVVSTQCCYHDAYCGKECEAGQIMGMPTSYASPAELVRKACAIDCDTNIRSGLIVSGDWFVDSKEKMQQILSAFPAAMAVDMESCAIAQTCYLYHTPFISFRVISDVPLKDTNAAQYYDFWERLANHSFHVTKEFIQIAG